MTKKAGSKRNTKIIKECLINAPVTNYNMAAYHYNFEHRQYELANPMGYKYAKMYPRTKIKLVSQPNPFSTHIRLFQQKKTKICNLGHERYPEQCQKFPKTHLLYPRSM